jgi:lipopolysaccharide transport system permease protein
MSVSHRVIIEPGRTERKYWGDLWRYREVFLFLSWRDLLVRYKQTAIGIAWAIIRPLLTTVVFTIVFERVAKLPAPMGVPYPLLITAAMLPWQFFANSLSEASNSLITNSNLISKVYFPRLVIPASSVIAGLVDFLITLALFVVLMFWYQFLPDWRLLMLPLFVLLSFLAALGAGLWLCALNVEYRDFRYVIPFIVQFGLYVSPVGFDSAVVPEQWRLLYSLNPMVGIIEGCRWSLLRGSTGLDWTSLTASVVLTTLICVGGIRYFRKMERTFADVI